MSALFPALGYIPDPIDLRDFDFRELAAGVGVQGRPDMREHRGHRLEQGGASSCVGFAIARALQLAAAVERRPDLPLASASFLYWNARRAETHGPGGKPEYLTPLIDRGCYPRIAMKALQTFGYASESTWPYDVSKINDQPPFKAYRSAYDQKGFRYYRINSGPGCTQLVASALSAGFPVIFGMQVDTDFTYHTDRKPIEKVDFRNFVGGHMMAALAVDKDLVHIDNWWGSRWGGYGDGMGALTRELFEGSWVHDIYALSVQPTEEV